MKTLAELVTRFCELVDGDIVATILKPTEDSTDQYYKARELVEILRDMEQQAKRDQTFAEQQARQAQEDKIRRMREAEIDYLRQ